MPYRSEKQRAFMHAKHPDIAKRWDAETGGHVEPSAPKGRPRMKASSTARALRAPRAQKLRG